MNTLTSLKWRASVRNYDTAKKVDQQALEALLEAGNLTATSGGLQPFKIAVVSNDELKKQLVPASFGQQQVGDASHLLVFSIETEINESILDSYIARTMAVRGVSEESLQDFKNSMNGHLAMMDDNARREWATKQAYIALGTVMTMAAELKIDTCPMEGFDPLQYQEILGLKSKNLMPVVILPIGYRSDKEVMADLPKVRKTREDFVLELN